MIGINAQAQQPAAPAAPAGAAGGNVGSMKVAVIDFAAFRYKIGELKAKYDKLEAEFGPRQQQLASLQSNLEAKQKTLQENKTLTPDQARKLNEEIESGKKEFQRSLEDAQATARKREGDETGATYDKIFGALTQFCTKNGITHVFDGRKLMESNFFLYLAPSANITDTFITEYNKANPAPAAAAATGKPASK